MQIIDNYTTIKNEQVLYLLSLKMCAYCGVRFAIGDELSLIIDAQNGNEAYHVACMEQYKATELQGFYIPYDELDI